MRKGAEGPEHCVFTEAGKNVRTCAYRTALVHREQSVTQWSTLHGQLEKDTIGTPQHVGIVLRLEPTAGRTERLEQGHSLGMDQGSGLCSGRIQRGGYIWRRHQNRSLGRIHSEERRRGSGRVKLILITSSPATLPRPPLSGHTGLFTGPRKQQANPFLCLHFPLLGKPQLSIAPSLTPGRTQASLRPSLIIQFQMATPLPTLTISLLCFIFFCSC